MSADVDRASRIRSVADSAVAHLAEAVRLGHPLDTSDLEALAEYERTRQGLASEAGLEPLSANFDAIENRIERQSARARLRPLVAAHAPGLAPLADVVAVAERALAGEEVDPRLLEILEGIVELAGPSREDPTLLTRLLTLASEVGEPVGLVQVVSFAAAGHLVLGGVEAEEDVGHSPRAENDRPEAETESLSETRLEPEAERKHDQSAELESEPDTEGEGQTAVQLRRDTDVPPDGEREAEVEPDGKSEPETDDRSEAAAAPESVAPDAATVEHGPATAEREFAEPAPGGASAAPHVGDSPSGAEPGATATAAGPAEVDGASSDIGTEPGGSSAATLDRQASLAGEGVPAALAQLVAERRFGLAMHLARAADEDTSLVLALRLLAIADADAVMAGAGPGGSVARETIEALVLAQDNVGMAARLLALAAAIPVVRVAPHLGAAQLIQDFVSATSAHAALHDFIETVADTAARGILIDDQLLGSLGDVAQRDERIAQLSADARAKMEHPPNLVYPRASELLRELIRSEASELGLILHVVARDDVGRLADVRAASERVGSRAHALDILATATEADRRRTKRKPIIGTAREGFINTAIDIAKIGGEWVRLHSAASPGGDQAWLADAGDRLRAAGGRLLAAGTSDQPSELLVGSAWRLAEQAACGLAAQLSTGTPAVHRPGDPVWCLGGELLRDPALRLESDLTPSEPPPMDRLLRLVGAPDWPAALRARAVRGDEPEVERLLGAVTSGEIQVAENVDELEADARHRLDEARKAAEHDQEQLTADLAARFQRGALSASDWQRFARQADEITHRADAPTAEKAAAYRQLRSEIVEAAAAHAAEIGDELKRRAEAASANTAQLQRIGQALTDEDVATAEHVVLALERGEPLLEPATNDDLLTRVFPNLSRHLLEARATASELADHLEETGLVAGLDVAPLEGERRSRAAGGLRALRDIHKEGRGGAAAVAQVLTSLGIRVDSCRASDKVSKWAAYEVAGAIADKALVPQFGSAASGRYRVLVIPASDATEELITSTARLVAGGPACILLHSRPLPAAVMRGVADLARRLPPDGQALVCDLAVCAAVAALAPGSFQHTARFTLPFTAVNPYDPYLSGLVPEEMFYGRRSALQDLVASNGNIAFVYGGRRLGKSALLRAAEREAARRDGIEAAFIDLKDEGIGFPDPPVRLAEVLEDRFAHVLRDASRKQHALARLPERVQALKASGGPRLLALLDEADDMIDADAQNGFRLLDTLRRLQEDSGKHIRFVFAGLHSVRRFADVRNLRLVQFGRSEAIGALEAEPARDLIRTPLEALGYGLDDRSINRVLTLTQYQPSLIQLVCDKLLKHLHGRTRSVEGPPYPVSIGDVDGVLRQPKLQEEITERFEWTTVLDPRYRVIALATAYLAAGESATQLFEVSDLREQCDFWWAAGFADTSDTEFQTLLEEMVGLGLLFTRDRRYGLYSPHVARLLGTEAQIIDRLEEAGRQTAPRRGFDGIAFRPALPPERRGQSGRLSPFNLRQVTRLQEPQDGLFSLISTPALGSDLVARALTYHLPSEEDYELLEGPPGDVGWIVQKVKRSTRRLHRIAWMRASDAEADALASGLVEAGRLLRRRDQHRASCKVLLVVEPESLATWSELTRRAGFADLDLDVMRIRRHTVESLASWSRVTNVDLPALEVPESAEAFLAATGGWPSLVDEAVAVLRREHELAVAVGACAAALTKDPAAFVTATGVLVDPDARGMFEAAIDMADANVPAAEGPSVLGEYHKLDERRAAAAWSLLINLGAIEITKDGYVRPEALLSGCFSAAALP